MIKRILLTVFNPYKEILSINYVKWKTGLLKLF